ncbi:rer-1 [Pristionchus pacificus]|uniref:Rer-1 n=1 Tax=Pristionchus pacificus TaxID=54126 RepID=A0A2A6CCE8_PRIPA|nr:rer-1 [Pristionchus pacificus]|eukprot:PDM75882.1 rer-1 [Pristionchus pacificus]
MFSPRFAILVLLYGFISPMVVHGKKLHSDEISTPEVVQTTTPSHNETSALETVEKMAIEAKDFVVDGASSLVHKVGELVRQAVQSLQEFMKSDDNSVTNSTAVEEKEIPSTTKKATKKKSKKLDPRLTLTRGKMDDSSDLRDQPGVVSRFFSSLELKYQYYLDRLTPFTTVRWLINLVFNALFIARMVYLQGFYIVTYALYIYYLNLFLLFLTPSIDPQLMDDDDDGPVLPSKGNDEFRPFMRRLPEFKFWHSSLKACIFAITCTFFEFFNVPVFWPILVLYFIILFCLTMKRQIMHMIKYRYIPFTVGKPKMAGKEDSGKVVMG